MANRKNIFFHFILILYKQRVNMTKARDEQHMYKTSNSTQRTPRKNHMKAKDYLKRQFNKDEDYKCKRYGKGMLVEARNEMVSRVLLSEGLTNFKSCPFKRIEAH